VKAIFLDRDGTLNRDLSYTYQIKDLEIIDGVTEGLQKLKSDFEFFIITNQSGIDRGLFSRQQAEDFTQAISEHLKKFGIEFKKIYMCPHLPEENCKCRKPNPFFMEEAAKEFDLDLKTSWVIGDRGTDIELAHRVGSFSILVLTGVSFTSISDLKSSKPTYIAPNLVEAAEFIQAEETLHKIIRRQDISKIVGKVRAQGKSIVTLNGSFDLLHSGHEKILSEAKAQGDVLIVALNSDLSIQSYKGLERPLNNEVARLRRMTAFRDVDHVTLFSETNPISLLEEIKPDVHVNGSEYGENCIEAPTVKKYGGRIHIVKLLEGRSTSALLEEKISK
jgi:rfaE bifunctional protein nucleotidyltransferase chain/domain